MPNEADVVRNRILFHLLSEASGKDHWKLPFEMKIMLASPQSDPPISKESVMPFARDLAEAIEFFHGAAVTIDLETMEARPARGEASAYIFFDGYKLTIGSIGYQG